MEMKDIGVVICCRQPSSRKVDEWVSELELDAVACLIICTTLRHLINLLYVD